MTSDLYTYHLAEQALLHLIAATVHMLLIAGNEHLE